MTQESAGSYFVRRGDQIFGPHDGEKLVRLAKAGKLLRDDLISPDKVRWVRADSVRKLFPGAEGDEAASQLPALVKRIEQVPAIVDDEKTIVDKAAAASLAAVKGSARATGRGALRAWEAVRRSVTPIASPVDKGITKPEPPAVVDMKPSPPIEAVIDAEIVSYAPLRETSPVPIRTQQPIKQCSFCGEDILAVAVKCKHCGEIVDPAMRIAEEARRVAEHAATMQRSQPQQIIQKVHVNQQTDNGAAAGCLTILILILFFWILAAFLK